MCVNKPLCHPKMFVLLQRLTQTLPTQMTNRSNLLEMSLSPPHLVVQKRESITCLTALPVLFPLSPARCNLPSHCKYWGFLFYGMKVCLVWFFSPHICLPLFSLDQWHKQEEWIYPQLTEEAWSKPLSWSTFQCCGIWSFTHMMPGLSEWWAASMAAW